MIHYPLGEDGDFGFVIKKDSDIVIFTDTSSWLPREILALEHEQGHIFLCWVMKPTDSLMAKLIL